MKTAALTADIYRQFFLDSPIPSLIVVPGQDLILEANPAAVHLYGYTGEHALCHVKWSALNAESPPETPEAYQAPGFACRQWTQDGRDIAVTLQGRRYEANGQTMLLLTATPEEKPEENKLSNLELVQMMIDLVPTPIYCKNSKAQYVLCNTAFEQHLRTSRKAVIGKTSLELLPLEYSAKYHRQDLALLDAYHPRPEGGEFDVANPEHLHPSPETIEYEASLPEPQGNGRTVIIRKTVFTDDHGHAGLVGVITDISDIKEQEKELRVVYTAMAWAREAFIAMDMHGHAIYLNNAFNKLCGYELAQLQQENVLQLLFGSMLPDTRLEWLESSPYWQRLELEGQMENRNGDRIPVSLRLIPVIEDPNRYTGMLAIVTDNTERFKEAERQRQIEEQLRQAQKLEAIGQLAAGIAHELNTPIQFVGDNINFLDDMFKDLLALSETCSNIVNHATENGGTVSTDDITTIKDKLEEVDIKYLSKEIPSAFEQSHDGVKRIADIVRAMKDFSHPGTGTRKPVDVNKALTNTVTIARNEWKYVSDVKLELTPELPMPPVYEGELKQVFLNLLVNAAHAIGDRQKQTGSTEKGTITITTRADAQWVYIDIADSGAGIPEVIRNHIFEPFFTTKEPGRGTGQGLAISREVMENKHQGKIWFDTEIGQGTVFHLQLPLLITEPPNAVPTETKEPRP